jgi:Domain of unknown function (DUF1996)
MLILSTVVIVRTLLFCPACFLATLSRPFFVLRSLSSHLDFGINATSDDLLASNCTSCAIDKDLSAYWTPLLYFRHSNGTFQRVTQVGGMLA